MNPQVFMSKRNGQLCVGLPLFLGRDFPVEPVLTAVTYYEEIGWALFVEDECQGLFVEEAIDVLPLERLGDL